MYSTFATIIYGYGIQNFAHRQSCDSVHPAAAFPTRLDYQSRKLLSQSEADVDRAIKARALADTINQLAHDVFEIESMFGSEITLKQTTPTEAEFRLELNRLRADYRKLKDLVGRDPARLEVIRKSEEAAERAFPLFLSLQQSLNTAGEQGRKEREPLWLGLRECATNIMSKDLVDIGKAEKAQVERIPEVQEEFRAKIRQLVFIGTGIILLLASVLAVFLTRSIMFRLKRINENAYRLAADQPLNPLVGGTDELASLDASFHKMAGLLKESIRNEQAVLENARDCICSIDAEGSITRANPACSVMFQLDHEDLLGRRFIDLIHDEDREKAHAFMLKQQSGESAEKISKYE